MSKLTGLLMGIALICSVMTACGFNGDTAGMVSGTYEIVDVIHIPLFSSSSKDWWLRNNKGVLFHIEDKRFVTDPTKALSPGVRQVDYNEVVYEKQELDNVLSTMSEDLGGIDLSSYEKRVCFKVIAQGEDSGFRIYCLDNEIWIAHYSWHGQKNDTQWADYIFRVVLK